MEKRSKDQGPRFCISIDRNLMTTYKYVHDRQQKKKTSNDCQHRIASSDFFLIISYVRRNVTDRVPNPSPGDSSSDTKDGIKVDKQPNPELKGSKAAAAAARELTDGQKDGRRGMSSYRARAPSVLTPVGESSNVPINASFK